MVAGRNDMIITIFAILMWLFMGVVSGYCLYEEARNFVDFTHVVILLYMLIFAALGLAFEARLSIVRQWFTFLSMPAGKGLFWFFCGTLGISFGFTPKPLYRLLPAILGIACFVVGVIVIGLGIKNKPKEPKGGAEIGGVDLPPPGNTV